MTPTIFFLVNTTILIGISGCCLLGSYIYNKVKQNNENRNEDNNNNNNNNNDDTIIKENMPEITMSINENDEYYDNIYDKQPSCCSRIFCCFNNSSAGESKIEMDQGQKNFFSLSS